MQRNNEISYLADLNDKQYEAAVNTEGPMLILAGAGSGKTSTMTRRIAYMIREKNISPYNILAVTFTNKAAAEMRERVESLVGTGLNIWIMTFHSACLRILRMNAEKAGYLPNLTVYDPVDQKTVVKNCIKAAGVDDKIYTPKIVLNRISKAKEKGMDSAEYAAQAGSYKERTIASLYARYETQLKKNNAIDFDDMIWRVVVMFEQHPEVLEKYQERFHYIMVDEYQDTNAMQYRLVKMLAAKSRNICVVGDDDQCIYEWRGADISNILSFEKDFPGAHVVKLEQNYRSAGNILKAAHSVISHNVQRKDKKLWTTADDGSQITYKRLDNERAEAAYIADEISELTFKEGRGYSDFAVLYRTNAQSRTFEETFVQKGIPYVLRGSLRFYDRKEIKDMIAYMRLVVNPDDDIALMRVINEPKRGVGPRTMEKLGVLAQQRGISLLRLMTDEFVVGGLSAKAASAIRGFVSLIAGCRAALGDMSVEDIYDRLLAGSGYLRMLEEQNTDEAQSRLENLMEFKSAIGERVSADPEMTLEDFLENITLDAEVEKTDDEASDDKVVLMTLHSAKGLEFPVVFMPGLEDGLFPGYRAMDSEEGISEERRLCYVGITRAKQKLYMTSARTRTLYGKTDYTKESQFLSELDNNLLDEGSDQVGAGSYNTRSDGYRSEVHYTSANRPFDPIRAQAEKIKKKNSDIQRRTQSAAGVYKKGMKVRHKKFGEGLVIDVTDSVVKVAFDKAGIKKLAAGIAPLEIIG
ncbi:MAG: UvrD-helicase domain-containing protein [Anaerovoracaceae bacterium]|nr:UvrD-helicase domain-containing protein [Bacillota bacterium]MDY2671011.1 UvrD-helicase domain-containing protein [Anaerovoracaceae bacterium]